MKRPMITLFIFGFCAALFLGVLLYRDGFFSSTLVVVSPPADPAYRLTDFGPPTRLTVDVDPSGVQRSKVVAEPIYADVRIPSFFDVVDVQLRLREAEDMQEHIQIGFELGRDSAQYAFGETSIEDIPALGQASLPTIAHATLSLVGIPHEDNRFRFVFSLPGVDPDHPVRIDTFTITARRTGNWKHMLSRFFHL